jgi:dTDP-4-amino-4,6-dideoxygalactose transaminase
MATDILIPLYKPHIPPGLDERLGAVLSSGQIAGGPCVAQFEDLLRDYLGNPWLTTVGDVSTALTLCIYN